MILVCSPKLSARKTPSNGRSHSASGGDPTISSNSPREKSDDSDDEKEDTYIES